MIILLGIPLWWVTTSIPRERLPLKAMEDYATGRVLYTPIVTLLMLKACQVEFPVKILVRSPQGLPDIDSLVLHAQHIIDDSNEVHAPFHIRFISGSTMSNTDASYVLEYLHDATANLASVSTNHINRTIRMTFPQTHQIVSHAQEIANFFVSTFDAEKQYIRHVLRGDQSDTPAPVSVRRAVRSSPRYQVTFSLLNGGAAGSIKRWEIERAVRRYLAPVQRQLNSITNLTIDSQIQFYAGLTFDPPANDDDNTYYKLEVEKLPVFINAAEWSLATAITSYPVINFILYVPDPSIRPLLIVDAQRDKIIPSNAFLLPQWGSIVIYNPMNASSDLATVDDLQAPFSTFVAHLLALLGVPDTPSNHAPPSNSSLSAWKRDGLMRQRIAENFISATNTMGTLARLVRTIDNMAIPHTILHDVQQTLLDIERVTTIIILFTYSTNKVLRLATHFMHLTLTLPS